jgi:hypothetical protein
LEYQNTVLKYEGQGRKINLSQVWVPVGEARHKERGNEGAYGAYVFYPYMKIEE